MLTLSAVAGLAHSSGVRISTGCAVTRILTRRGGRRGATVTGVAYTDADGVAATLDADVVVGAADHRQPVALEQSVLHSSDHFVPGFGQPG